MIVVVVGLIGGYVFTSHQSVQNQYATAMANGKDAIQDKNYNKAVDSFQTALRKKSNDETAQTYLTQTQSFVTAESEVQSGNFDTAKSAYNETKNAEDGSNVLVKRAKDALKNLKTIQLKYETYQQIYDSALTQNKAQQYTDSNNTLDQIFNDDDSRQTYYSKLYNKAVDLRSANNKALKKGGDDTPSADVESASSASDGLTDAENKAADNYKGKNEYTVDKSRTEINGKQITAAQITAARETIKASGLEEGSFSDQDVRDGLIAANKQGISFADYLKKTYK